MDIKTYNALMGASSVGVFSKNKEKTAIEFNFSVSLKMKFQKISKEDAIKQTAQERLSGILTGFLSGLMGLICCLFLAYKKESDLVLTIPLFIGYAPLLYANIFSNWWHKTKVVNK